MATNKNIPPPAQFIDPATGYLTRAANNFLNSITRSSNIAAEGEIATPPGSGLDGGGTVADGVTLSIAPAGVTNAMLRDSQPFSVIGRYSSTTGSPADIVATANNRVLARIDDVLAFYPLSSIPAVVADGNYGDITVSSTGAVWTINSTVVTFAKVQNITTARLLGRTTAGSGSIEQLTVGTGLVLSGGSLSLDATLGALSAYNTNGLLTQTAADTFTGRTLTGTANQVAVSNGDGVSGNPTVALAPSIVTPGDLDTSGLLRCDSFRIDQSPTSETVVCTHTITISVNGTNYKIPIVAA